MDAKSEPDRMRQKVNSPARRTPATNVAATSIQRTWNPAASCQKGHELQMNDAEGSALNQRGGDSVEALRESLLHESAKKPSSPTGVK